MPPRKRPERKKSQWADITAANRWFEEECHRRAVPRDEALDWWENLSPMARIKRHRSWLRARVDNPTVSNEAIDMLVKRLADGMAIPANVERFVRDEGGGL